MKWTIFKDKVVDIEAKEIICTLPMEKDTQRRLRKMRLIASAPEVVEENVLLKLKLKEMTERYEECIQADDDYHPGVDSHRWGKENTAIAEAKKLYEDKHYDQEEKG